MLSLDEALTRLLALARPTDTETIPLDAALGRVLVEPRMRAPISVPPFDNSAMDGYAVRAADTPGELAAGCGDRRPAPYAGTPSCGRYRPADHDRWTHAVRRGHGGAHRGCSRAGWSRQTAGCTRRVCPPAGSDTPKVPRSACRAGSRPPGIAVLASLGIGPGWRSDADRSSPCSRPGTSSCRPGTRWPRARSTMRTGLRWRPPFSTPGGPRRRLAVVRDDASAVADALHEASGESDLVITSGGVSVGTSRSCAFGARAAGEPGLLADRRPAGQATGGRHLRGRVVVGLPGNPVSALVTFELFVRRVHPPGRWGWTATGGCACAHGRSVLSPRIRPPRVPARDGPAGGRRRSAPVPQAVRGQPSSGRSRRPMGCSSCPRASRPQTRRASTRRSSPGVCHDRTQPPRRRRRAAHGRRVGEADERSSCGRGGDGPHGDPKRSPCSSMPAGLRVMH